MMDQLYHKLEWLDIGIAYAYDEATNRTCNGTIDRRGAERIFAKAIDGDRITPQEAKALLLVVEEAAFERGVATHLVNRIREDKTRSALLAGAARHLNAITGGRADVFRALSMGVVGRIHFWSPESRIWFIPNHYLVIRHLIMTDEIQVYEVQASGLNHFFELGSYTSGLNELVYYEVPNWDFYCREATIVHEATHAIQDWMDIRPTREKYTQTDAILAQVVAQYAVSHLVPRREPHRTAYLTAVPIVLRGDARYGNQRWYDAYYKVSDLYAQLHPEGAFDKNRYRHGAIEQDAQGRDEVTRFQALLTALQQRR